MEEEELANVSGPFSIAAAEKDTIFTTELRHKSETILIETKQPFPDQFVQWSCSRFCNERGFEHPDPESLPGEQAFFQAVAWFNEASQLTISGEGWKFER